MPTPLILLSDPVDERRSQTYSDTRYRKRRSIRPLWRFIFIPVPPRQDRRERNPRRHCRMDPELPLDLEEKWSGPCSAH